MPNLKRKTKTPPGPKRFTTTLQYLHAYRGQFTFVDHGTWTTVARNLDISVRHDTGEYLGTATITDGTVRIKDYEPMRADMRVTFKVDGSLLRLPEIELYTDGAHSLVTGEVDFGRPWPQMIYHVDSRVDLWRMREIFFANESWRSRGEARFTGDFHLFPGGHELKGDFTSDVAYVNAFAVPGPARLARVGAAPLRGDEGVGPVLRRHDVVPVPDGADLRPDAGGRAVRRDLPRRRSRAALGRHRDARPAAAGHGQRRQRPRVAARRVLAAPRRRPHGHRAAGRPVAAAARGRSRRGGDPRAGAGVRPRTEPEPLPRADRRRRRVRLPPLSRVARGRPESPGHRTHLRRVPGPHGVRRPIRVPVLRAQRRLAGERPPDGGDPHGLRIEDRRDQRRGARRVPRDDDEVVQEPAHPGGVPRARHARVGRGVGARGRPPVDREQLRRHLEGDGHARAVVDRGGRPVLARLPAPGRRRGDQRPGRAQGPADARPQARVRARRLAARRPACRASSGSPIGTRGPSATGGCRSWTPRHGASRVDRATSPDAVRREGGPTRRGRDPEGRRHDHRRGVRRVERHVLVRRPRRADPAREGRLAEVRRPSSGRASCTSPPRAPPRSRARATTSRWAPRRSPSAGKRSARSPCASASRGASSRSTSSKRPAPACPGPARSRCPTRWTRTSASGSTRRCSIPYVRLFEPRLSPYTRAAASGSVRVIGQLANWDRLSATATIDALDVSLFDYQISNDGPIRLAFENNTITRAAAEAGRQGHAGWR